MELANNTFTGGMILDINELDTPSNTYCINALNATVATFNGNEGAIQNEMGNVKIGEAQLPENSIILGSAEYGGVIYYVLLLENENNQIGSFPSPNWEAEKEENKEREGELIWNYSPLKVGIKNGNEEDLNFKGGYNTSNAVNILVEPSFDGSVNLILNDGVQSPRMINSGFHVQANNRYKIIERYNDNNTNRYLLNDDGTIDELQSSLYRNFSKLSKFNYLGTTDGGNLKVGNYVFYAVSCDKDGNESDIICESGVISIFIGKDGDPFSVNGGVANENSYKCIKLSVENIDPSYHYIKLYYTRTTAQNNQLAETLAFKIDRLYEVNNNSSTIIISGNETTESISINDLNIQYFNANSAKAQALNQNMLFLANLTQDNGEDSLEYIKLRDLSVKIIPKPECECEIELDLDYNSTSGLNYYSSTFIYEKTGYHDEEYYRFGIVYIRKDGSLTPVFNTLGYEDLNELNNNLSWNWNIPIEIKNKYNNAGVVKISYTKLSKSIKDVIGIKFELPDFTELKEKYKGYFFVRQKRIPTILAQGYATNVCEEAYLPSINCKETYTISENNVKVKNFHLFESFVLGYFKLINSDSDLLTYPITTGNSRSSLNLNQNYKKRLFDLVPEKTWAFFDRYSAKNNVFGEFYNYLGGSWSGTTELNSGTRYDLYGGDELDKYLTLYSNNATDDGEANYKADKYRSDFYYFVKVKLINNSELYNNPTSTYDYNNEERLTLIEQSVDIPSNFKTNTFEGWFLHDSGDNKRVIYKNNKSEYYLVVSSTETNTPERRNEDGKLYFEYDDDEVKSIAEWVSSRYSKLTTKVTATPWGYNDEYMDCPVYIEVEGNYYTYVAFGPGYAENKWGDLERRSLSWILDWILKTLKSEEVTTSTVLGGTGIDLSVPTFNGKYYYTEETDLSEIKKIAIKTEPLELYAYAVYCPEYELNRPYYNNLFTGNDFKISAISNENYLYSDKQRLYKYPEFTLQSNNKVDVKAISVNEGVSLVSLQHETNNTKEAGNIGNHFDHGKNLFFSTQAGTAQKVNFKFAGAEFLALVDSNVPLTQSPFNIVRGIYGSYVGIYSQEDIANKIINIYSPEINLNTLVLNRALDSSPYYAISDRIEFNDSDKNELFYRGDCYIGYFTHRVNRNFQDPTSPYNDTIIDKQSFANGFKECFQIEIRTFDTTKEGAKHFNLGDINAIQLGSWVTFPVRSTMNICLRAVDRSYVDERLLCGNDRSFYPIHGIDASGSYKIPESDAFNVGFNKSGSERVYFNLTQLVYNKVYYKNRIVYSNVLQPSALKNGNRVFLAEHYKDYTDQYGEITKLISLAGNLLVICEHGIMLVPVNERALAAEGQGGNIFINTSNVLPDNPKIISDTYGSKWEESIVNTPYGVYGIDESSKKIWYTNGDTLELISDFKVQEFLNNWLKVGSEKQIGLHNIKSHYIKYKNDVIFTLYDFESELNPHPDVLWNLCWNINERQFRTFYSWLPLDSLNIGNNLVSVNLFKDEGNKNYLWKHGHSFRVPSTDRILPTNFYGEQHPFEFEFVVRDNPGVHKIFDNLQIISNKAAPESFHYEIVGECYNFGNLKKVAYIRLELLKKIYSSVITNLKYDDTLEGNEVPYDESNHGLALMFPQYYSRQDIPLLIYDSYKQMTCPSYDYNALSGTELVEYNKLNEYRLWNHVKAVDVRDKGGLLRGNMYYKEDKWDVQINPINYLVKNEARIEWKNNKVPVDLTNIKLGLEYWGKEIQIPLGFGNDITNKWNIAKRKEVAVKDKFIKIRIRYTGNELAIISAVNTLYRLSYA